MTTYVITGLDPLLVRVDYSDAAGGFGGWFLVNLQDDGLQLDDDSNPANGQSAYSKLNAVLDYGSPGMGGGGTLGSISGRTNAYGVSYSGHPKYRQRLLDLVHGRLERMFGVGHSATWTATLVESVTPAVIDDNF